MTEEKPDQKDIKRRLLDIWQKLLTAASQAGRVLVSGARKLGRSLESGWHKGRQVTAGLLRQSGSKMQKHMKAAAGFAAGIIRQAKYDCSRLWQKISRKSSLKRRNKQNQSRTEQEKTERMRHHDDEAALYPDDEEKTLQAEGETLSESGRSISPTMKEKLIKYSAARPIAFLNSMKQADTEKQSGAEQETSTDHDPVDAAVFESDAQSEADTLVTDGLASADFVKSGTGADHSQTARYQFIKASDMDDAQHRTMDHQMRSDLNTETEKPAEKPLVIVPQKKKKIPPIKRRSRQRVYRLKGYTTVAKVNRKHQAEMQQQFLRKVLLYISIILMVIILFSIYNPFRDMSEWYRIIGISDLSDLTQDNPLFPDITPSPAD